jgi:hypothetical protein
MRALLLAVIGLICSGICPSQAIPPPPADPKYGNALAEIVKLEPFLGVWTGLLPGKNRYPVTRTLRLLGDVIVFESGYEKADQVTIVEYNLDTHGYRLLLPGYRHTFLIQPDSAADVKRVDLSTIQWVAHDKLLSPQDAGPDVRHTVTLQSGTWHEKLEWIYKDGRVETFVEMDLTRSQAMPAGPAN